MKTTYTFHVHRNAGSSDRMAPSGIYVTEDCEPLAIRLYAEQAPLAPATFDVYDDGDSILSRYATLAAGQNGDELADNFITSTMIDAGSWLSCDMLDAGGGYNFTLQLDVEIL